MARAGMVHKPGLAAEMMEQLKPLLAADGIDLDDPEGVELDTLQATLDRATEQHNLALFTPIGDRRRRALRELARFSMALAAGDESAAGDVLEAIEPDAYGDMPAVADVIGAALGLLDTWLPDRQWPLGGVRVPRGDKRARGAATDVLALARKGRAFDALGSLTVRHGGQALFVGCVLLVGAALKTRADREGTPVEQVIAAALGEDAAQQASEPVSSQHPEYEERMPQPGVHGQHVSQHPAPRSGTDRATLRAFGDWLDDQGVTIGETVGESIQMLGSVFAVLHQLGYDPDDPDDVVSFIEQSRGTEPPEEMLMLLDEYIHFRLDSTFDDAWEEAHAVVEELLEDDSGIGGALTAAIEAGMAVDPELRHDALAQVTVVAAVPRLLAWIGAGRPVSPSGGVRRADIAGVAALLGVAAVGVSKHSAREWPDQPLAGLEEPIPASDVVEALSMFDVPELAAWWKALEAADVIERVRTRVRPGPAAHEWMSEGAPPREGAEMVAGLFLSGLIAQEWGPRGAIFEDQVIVDTVALLVAALDPDGGHVAPPPSLLRPRTLTKLQRAADAGLLQIRDGSIVIPPPLVLTVARGLIAAIAALAAQEQGEDEDFDVS